MDLPLGIYVLKVNNRNTRKRSEICSKLTMKNQNDVSYVVLVFLSLTMKYLTPFSSVFIVDFEQVNVSWVWPAVASVTKIIIGFWKDSIDWSVRKRSYSTKGTFDEFPQFFSEYYGIYRGNCVEVICKKDVFKKFVKFIEKYQFRNLCFNKVANWRLVTAIFKKRLRHKWFLVNFAKFLRTTFS